jgi:uncharacterized protein
MHNNAFFMTYYGSMILLIPAILLGIWAQFKVRSSFKKFSKIRSVSGATGFQAARYLLDQNNLNDIKIEIIGGNLSDHYDPRSRVMRLSEAVANSSSLAALGVAAHETGHALQHAQKYIPIQLRNAILPAANLGSTLLWPLAIGGLLFWGKLLWIGIALYSFAVLFHIVTLPVEFNASSRALVILNKGGFLVESEIPGAKAVLNAAAMTYVAATLAAILNLIRLIIMARD